MAASKKSRGLGRGLDALFGDVEINPTPAKENKKENESVTEDKPAADTNKSENKSQVKNEEADESGVLYIDINDIKPNATQPRKHFDEEKLQELAESIKQHGLIQPIVLRKMDKGYEIVAGERRWRAARLIALKKIPCIIRELSDEENMLLAIIENMQREDLNPIEEAEGIKQMIETYGLTQEQVSISVGKSRPYITNSLRLLKLPEVVRNLTEAGKITTGHARALAAIKDENTQIILANRTAEEGLSVRQIEKLAGEAKKDPKKASRKKAQKSADEKRLEEDLKNALGTKVNLKKSGKKGKIEIEYYSREELERLIELLKTLG
ncbi:MAG: ParB/RepB/Spo0J family partition protein [Firmicutes bacterium]|nr:ParB/RepB/Spo0J family partition protein [Bacillota bacterium]